MNLNLFQIFRIKLICGVGAACYIALFIWASRTSPELVNTWYWCLLFVFSCSSPIWMLDLINSNPHAKLSGAELHELENRGDYFVPVHIVSKLLKKQGFVYLWQVRKHCIDRKKVNAQRHYGVFSTN